MDIQPIFEIREPAEGEVQLPEGAKMTVADLRTLRVPSLVKLAHKF